MLQVLSQSHSLVFAARKRYIIDITWPLSFNTAVSKIQHHSLSITETLMFFLLMSRNETAKSSTEKDDNKLESQS